MDRARSPGGGDPCAEDVARGKPDPAGYLAAAASLGAAPELCLVVEDAPPGILAARAAGMRVVALATTYPATQLREADAIATTLANLRVELRDDRVCTSTVEDR